MSFRERRALDYEACMDAPDARRRMPCIACFVDAAFTTSSLYCVRQVASATQSGRSRRRWLVGGGSVRQLPSPRQASLCETHARPCELALCLKDVCPSLSRTTTPASPCSPSTPSWSDHIVTSPAWGRLHQPPRQGHRTASATRTSHVAIRGASRNACRLSLRS